MKTFLFKVWEKLKQKLQGPLSFILYLISLPYGASLRVKLINQDRLDELKNQGNNVILAFWHGAGFLPVWCLRNRRICLYSSILRSKEEQPSRLTQFKRRTWLKAFSLLGYKIVDASLYGNTETRGVIKFMEEIKNGHDAAIAVDGPNGPIYHAKEGAVYLAKKTGAVILPVAAEAVSKKIKNDQWDKLFIPRLFSKAALLFGEPIKVSCDADENIIHNLTLKLQDSLNNLTDQARSQVVA